MDTGRASCCIITDLTCFPPVWRTRALRSMLPEELADQLRQWREWRTWVREGRYIPYLARLYEHEVSVLVHAHMRELIRTAAKPVRRIQLRATPPEYFFIRGRVLSLNPSRILPPPSPEGKFLPDREPDFSEINALVESVERLTRLWNESAPENRRVNGLSGEVPPFSGFKAQVEDRDLEKLFDWGFRCVEDGVFLFRQ